MGTNKEPDEIVNCLGCGRDTKSSTGLCVDCRGGVNAKNIGKNRGYKIKPSTTETAEGMNQDDRDYEESV